MTDAPTRTCIGCRLRAPKPELVRLVWGEHGLQVDWKQRSAGRGAYLHQHPECLAQAVRRRALGRALRREGIPFADLERAGADLMARPRVAP